METLKLIAAVAFGFGAYWLSRRLRELAGFRVKERFRRVEEEIAKSVLTNDGLNIDELIERENKGPRFRKDQ